MTPAVWIEGEVARVCLRLTGFCYCFWLTHTHTRHTRHTHTRWLSDCSSKNNTKPVITLQTLKKTPRNKSFTACCSPRQHLRSSLLGFYLCALTWLRGFFGFSNKDLQLLRHSETDTQTQEAPDALSRRALERNSEWSDGPLMYALCTFTPCNSVFLL